MAKAKDETLETTDAPEKVPLPTADEEFTFESIDASPAWVDPGWAGYSQGPALQLPNDLSGKPPYTTITARVGDTVRFVAAKGARPAHFEVTAGDQTVEDGTATVKPAQQSAASLEDMLQTGAITPDELGPDAKSQVSDRSPHLAKVVSGEEPPPAEAQQPPVKATSA